MARCWIREVSRNLYLLRVDDDETRYFEGLWCIPEGVTYNSYVLVSDEGAIVFDTWKGRYSIEFIECLSKVVDPRDVRYVVVNHAEPDHSGALPRLLEAIGLDRVEVVGHSMARDLLESFYGLRIPRFRAVGDGDVLRVGGYAIRFFHTPWLHWPETIMSFVEGLGVLISCDAFGGFSIPKGVFDDEVDVAGYERFVRKYFASVVGKYARFVVSAIDKLKGGGVEPRVVAPSHGVVWRKNPKRVVELYRGLATEEAVNPRKVVVVYSSSYGFTERAAEAVAQRLKSAGFEVVVHGFTDSRRSSAGDALGDIVDASTLVLGLSTYEGRPFPIATWFADLLVEKLGFRKSLRVVAMVSYGWGSAAGKVVEMLSRAGFRSVEVVDFRGAPTQSIVDKVVSLVARGSP